MKKVGVVTINDNDNYGNRLQNYATQSFLNKLDLDCITIKNKPLLNKKKNNLEYILRNTKSFLFRNKHNGNDAREELFEKFNEKINFSKKTFNWFNLKWLKDYDYFITGSDQVWNPGFRLSNVDLLSFAEENKRIAFSASIAFDYLSDIDMEHIKKEVSNYKAISVREETGKQIIEKVTGRTDIEVLVDPTMLLTAEEWDKISKKPEQLKTERYILNYFLGELSDVRKKEIQRIADENNCEIINILDKNSPFYETGPSEFLYLEKNAFLICTDSFHSSIFAILYNRPFIVFDREDKTRMNSRLETLLNKFKLKNRSFNRYIKEEQLQVDYTEAYKILDIERKKSKDFLKRALDLEETRNNDK